MPLLYFCMHVRFLFWNCASIYLNISAIFQHQAGNMASLDEYLDAAAGFVSSLPVGDVRNSAQHEVFQRLMRMLGSTRLSFLQAAAANQKLATMGFSAETMQELSSKVVEATQRGDATGDSDRRRPLQDWTAIASYFTEQQWALLADRTTSEMA